MFLFIVHLRRFSCLSFLFFGILHSDGFMFPFLLCFSLLFFSQLFLRPPHTTILPFCIFFSRGWSWSLPPVQCHEPPSIVLQTLCLSDLIPWIYLSLSACLREAWSAEVHWIAESDMTETELNWADNAAAGLWSILGIAGLWSVPLLREGEPSWFSLNSKRNLGH